MEETSRLVPDSVDRAIVEVVMEEAVKVEADTFTAE